MKNLVFAALLLSVSFNVFASGNAPGRDAVNFSFERMMSDDYGARKAASKGERIPGCDEFYESKAHLQAAPEPQYSQGVKKAN